MDYIQRYLRFAVQDTVNQYPILAITGPRQAGKTTFLSKLFSDYTYVSLENPDNRQFALEDPNGFLKQYSEKVILDEVQQAPELFSYLQTKVDLSGMMGQYILSGSQNFQLIQKISQSLAGRVALFRLFPFDFQELKASSLDFTDWTAYAFRGFYPVIYDRGVKPAMYYANYIETYIERDIRMLSNVHDLDLFRKFIKLCAARVGQLFNMSSIANECGISQPTAKSWLSLLESSFIIFRLPPYFNNFNKRIVKSPKIFFYDTGLLSHLLDISSKEMIKTHSLKGSIFENFIVAELIKRKFHKVDFHDYYFWRDSNGHEVDLLSKVDENYRAIEIKATETIRSNLYKELNYFENLVEPFKAQKTLVYGGLQSQNRNDILIKSWIDLD